MQHIILLFLALSSLFALEVRAQSPVWTQIANPAGLQVNGVSFSADGTEILSGTNCHPSYLRLYDVVTGAINWDYQVGNNLMCMMGVGISANGQYLAAVEELGNVLIFDYTQSPPDSITTIPMGTSAAFSIAFSPASDKVAVGGSSGKLQTYNLPSGSLDRDIAAHTTYVTAVAYSPDGQLIVSGGTDNKAKIWNTSGQLQHQLLGHTNDVTGLRFTPDNLRVISSSKDNTIRVWEVATGNLVHTFNTGTSDVNGMALSPDGQHIVSVSNDGYIRFWNAVTYAFEGDILQAEGATPICVDWSADGQKIATGTSAGKVTLYLVPALVGTADASKSAGLTAYPNPFHESFQIQLEGGQAKDYTLRDPMGRVVKAGWPVDGGNFSISLDGRGWAAGVYCLEVHTLEGNTLRRTVVKQ
jgi:WD40 repeat protein